MIQSASAVLPRVAKSDIAYAGFWRRLLAYLIDGTLLAGVELALYSTVHVLAPDNLDAVANIVPVAVAIGWVLAAVTPRKQALHDLLAGTLVLRKVNYFVIGPEAPTEPGDHWDGKRWVASVPPLEKS